MSDAAEFVIKLIDRATAPAKRISSAFATIDKALKPVKKNAAFKALDKAGDKLFDFGKAAVVAGGALAVGLSVALTKAAVDAAMFTQNTTLAFTQLTHSAASGKEAFGLVQDLVGELGLDLHDTTDNFRRLLAAQFSIKESTELVKMSADLTAIGIHGEEAARILTAISQIKAKGKLQAEEMMQLAEAGISLTLVNGQLQKALGKTASEVDKMKQAGKISGEVGIAAIQAAVKEKLGIANFGEARRKFVTENLSGMIDMLKAQGDLLFLKLGDSIMGAAKAMGPLVQDTSDWVSTLDTSNITAVVSSVLETLRALIPVGREFITGFLSGFGQLSDGLRVNIDASTLVAAADAGRSVANAMGMIITAATMAASALSFFTTPVGKVVLGLGLAAIVAVKVTGAISAIAVAVGAVTPVFAFLATAIPTVLGVILTTVSGFVLAVGAVPLAIIAAFAAIGFAIFHWWDEIDAFFGGLPGRMLEIGKAMMSALGAGITAGLGAAWQAASSVATGTVQAVKDAIGMHSPPAEFINIGVASAEAMGTGMESGASGLQSASAKAMAAPSLSGAASAIGGGGGSAPVVHLAVNVDGSKDPRETAQTIAELLPSLLAHAFESIGNPSPQAA